MSETTQPQSVLEPAQELKLIDKQSENLTQAQQVQVTRTLQMLVYPSLVAFVILAAYGFYLVQSLTTDVHRLTLTISSMNQSMQGNMNNIAASMTNLSGQIDKMVDSTHHMSANIQGMSQNIASMSNDMSQMNSSTQNMAVSTYNMQRDMWSMNRNISKPMKMFSSFMPFGSSDNHAPYVIPPPAYYANPYYMPSYAPSTALGAANPTVTPPESTAKTN